MVGKYAIFACKLCIYGVEVADKRIDVCVLGLGVTGYATAAYFHEQGLRVCVLDDHINPPLLERLKKDYPQIKFGSVASSWLRRIDKVVISPGIKPTNPVVIKLKKLAIPIYSDIDIFLQHWDKPVYMITGSNGKSTVVKLLHDMLAATGKRCCMLGNIGKPVLSTLTQSTVYDCAVVEVSSFQLYWSKKIRATVGAVLNISPNHLDWHDSWDCYVNSKLRLLAGSAQIVCDQKLAPLLNSPRFTKPAWIGTVGEITGPQAEILKQVPASLQQSVLSAWAIGEVIGIATDCMQTAIHKFQPWPYRCQRIVNAKGIWYNDAKSSNLAAAKHALDSIHQKHGKKMFWIAGGRTKNEDFTVLAAWIKSRVVHAFVYGEDRQIFVTALREHCPVTPVEQLQDAVALVAKGLKKEDVVVFSPAAASFDQFENYQHRGQVFTEKVHRHSRASQYEA